MLIVHSPPHGHCDQSSAGEHLGSDRDPRRDRGEGRRRWSVCGHIHEAWGERSEIGDSEIANLGPAGAEFEV